MMEMLGVPALVFALGMYLPLELNTPALVGGFLAHFLGQRSEKLGGPRGAIVRERGVIIASGLMAGGAIGRRHRGRSAPGAGLLEDPHHDAFLQQRARVATGLRGAVHRALHLRLVRIVTPPDTELMRMQTAC